MIPFVLKKILRGNKLLVVDVKLESKLLVIIKFL